MKTSPQNVKGHIEQNRRIFIVVIKENKLALCSYPTEFRLFNAMVTFVIEIPFQLSKAVFFFFFFLSALRCVWWWCRNSQRLPRVNHKSVFLLRFKNPWSLWFKAPLRFYQIFLAEGSHLFPLLSLSVLLPLFVSLSLNPPDKSLCFS